MMNMSKINDSIDERWREKYYDKVDELNAIEKVYRMNRDAIEDLKQENERLRVALKDVMAHAKEPFLGPKWASYIYEVAEDALK